MWLPIVMTRGSQRDPSFVAVAAGSRRPPVQGLKISVLFYPLLAHTSVYAFSNRDIAASRSRRRGEENG